MSWAAKKSVFLTTTSAANVCALRYALPQGGKQAQQRISQLTGAIHPDAREYYADSTPLPDLELSFLHDEPRALQSAGEWSGRPNCSPERPVYELVVEPALPHNSR